MALSMYRALLYRGITTEISSILVGTLNLSIFASFPKISGHAEGLMKIEVYG
jgi:hypothetical protein